jgi:hypothetical protein
MKASMRPGILVPRGSWQAQYSLLPLVGRLLAYVILPESHSRIVNPSELRASSPRVSRTVFAHRDAEVLFPNGPHSSRTFLNY